MSVVQKSGAGGSKGGVVLVTDGESRAALATTRSLGRAGYAIHVVSETGRSVSGASRWCQQEYRAPDATTDPQAWSQHIEVLSDKLRASVLPVTELSIGNLFAAGSETRIDLIAPPRPVYEAAIDKQGLIESARKIGIEVPASILVERLDALESLPAPLTFPVVAKPRRSKLYSNGKWHSPEVKILRDASAFRKAVACWSPSHGDTLIQEFIPGHGEGLFAICAEGQVRARFAHRRLREKPPLGGVSVLRESIPISPEVGEAGKRLLAHLGFTGLAMVEFRRAPDGRLFLMEINPRPWGSIQLAIDSGIDFPRLMVEEHRGRDHPAPVPVPVHAPAPAPAPAPVAEIGVRTRWLLGDLDHWLICARSSSLRRELDTSLLRISYHFMRSFVDGSHLEVFRADDLGPFRREVGQWLAAVIKATGA